LAPIVRADGREPGIADADAAGGVGVGAADAPVAPAKISYLANELATADTDDVS
jgi:hypothetical protein